MTGWDRLARGLQPLALMPSVRHALPVLALLAAVAAACGPVPHYSVRQAALVPEAAPPMRSGAAMGTLAEVSLNAPHVASAGEATADEHVGVELPGFSLSAAGRLRVARGFDV